MRIPPNCYVMVMNLIILKNNRKSMNLNNETSREEEISTKK
jgi:hypothetical protein